MTSNVLRSVSSRVPGFCHRKIIRQSYSTNMDANETFDLVVVGGGIVGCATAREVLLRHPQFKVALVEKESELARHQTSHNSGVIHSGVYYKPGSIKAKLCVEGAKMAYDYIEKNDIPYKKIGKLIVASDPIEIERLKDIYERGLQNKVPDIKLVDKAEINKIEPYCKAEKAIYSPWTGIVDWAQVCHSFAEDFKEMGGQIFTNFEVSSFAELIPSSDPEGPLPISVQSKNRCILTKYVLTCAGLHSDRVAAMTGCSIYPMIVPFRGSYLHVKDNKKEVVKMNIYPVPDPRLPFLGEHFTPRMNGDMWLGPNAVLSLSREGYRWYNVNLKDVCEMAKYPGLYKLMFRFFIPGCYELIKSIIYPLSLKHSQKFVPEITYKDVKRGQSGVRAQALDKSGELIEDFVFDNGVGTVGSRVLHVRNAASPGATSSMAIAKYIADKLDNDFKLS